MEIQSSRAVIQPGFVTCQLDGYYLGSHLAVFFSLGELKTRLDCDSCGPGFDTSDAIKATERERKINNDIFRNDTVV